MSICSPADGESGSMKQKRAEAWTRAARRTSGGINLVRAEPDGREWPDQTGGEKRQKRPHRECQDRRGC